MNAFIKNKGQSEIAALLRIFIIMMCASEGHAMYDDPRETCLPLPFDARTTPRRSAIWRRTAKGGPARPPRSRRRGPHPSARRARCEALSCAARDVCSPMLRYAPSGQRMSPSESSLISRMSTGVTIGADSTMNYFAVNIVGFETHVGGVHKAQA